MGWAKMQRDDKLLRDFAEIAARQDCVLPSSKTCLDKEGYSEALWCIPCRARDTLKKVNAPLPDPVEEAKIRSIDRANQNALQVMKEAEERDGQCHDPACPMSHPHDAHGGRIS